MSEKSWKNEDKTQSSHRSNDTDYSGNRRKKGDVKEQHQIVFNELKGIAWRLYDLTADFKQLELHVDALQEGYSNIEMSSTSDQPKKDEEEKRDYDSMDVEELEEELKRRIIEAEKRKISNSSFCGSGRNSPIKGKEKLPLCRTACEKEWLSRVKKKEEERGHSPTSSVQSNVKSETSEDVNRVHEYMVAATPQHLIRELTASDDSGNEEARKNRARVKKEKRSSHFKQGHLTEDDEAYIVNCKGCKVIVIPKNK